MRSVIVGMMMILFVACGGSDTNVTSTTSRAGTNGTATVGTSPDSSSDFAPLQYGQTMWAGSSSFTSVGVQVTNPNADAWVAVSDYSFTVFGDNDQILHVDKNVRSLAPSQTIWIIGIAFPIDQAAVRRVDFQMTPKFQSSAYPGPVLTITQHNLGPDKHRILGIVRNDGPGDASQGRIEAVVKGADGKVLAFAEGFAQGLTVGAEVPFQASISGDLKAIDAGTPTYEIQVVPEATVLFAR